VPPSSGQVPVRSLMQRGSATGPSDHVASGRAIPCSATATVVCGCCAGPRPVDAALALGSVSRMFMPQVVSKTSEALVLWRWFRGNFCDSPAAALACPCAACWACRASLVLRRPIARRLIRLPEPSIKGPFDKAKPHRGLGHEGGRRPVMELPKCVDGRMSAPREHPTAGDPRGGIALRRVRAAGVPSVISGTRRPALVHGSAGRIRHRAPATVRPCCLGLPNRRRLP
jgi:hypothetical protein